MTLYYETAKDGIYQISGRLQTLLAGFGVESPYTKDKLLASNELLKLHSWQLLRLQGIGRKTFNELVLLLDYYEIEHNLKKFDNSLPKRRSRLNKDRDYQIFIKRIRGAKLSELGREYNLSKDRVAMICLECERRLLR